MFKGIDLFSDTVTQPTMAMKKAMIEAELGDEQLGEDPTTRKLEERIADILGHSAAMFFPSATMANEVAICLQCARGDELIAAETCHLFMAETGGPAVHAGAMIRPIRTANGVFKGDDVRQTYRWAKGPHYPATKLVSVENTTNMGGGIAWSLAELDSVLTTSHELGLKTHLDGARFFNAVVSSQLKPHTVAGRFDTTTICFSKGLGCPTGAVLTFPKHDYDKIRRLKQLFGGAMRQSGMLAAACLYALDNHIARLQEDHENAQLLAVKLSENIPQIRIENNPPATNMVFFSLHSTKMAPAQFLQECILKGLRFSQPGENRFRAVTHLGIKRDDITQGVKIVKEIFN